MTKQSVSDGRVARWSNLRLASSLGRLLVESAISEHRAEAEKQLAVDLGVFAGQPKRTSARSFE